MRGARCAALASLLGLGALLSGGCDAALGLNDQHDLLDNLTYCDCFSEQGIAVENRCNEGYDALVAGVGDDVTINTMSKLAAQCSSCSDDAATLVECYDFLPDLKDEGEACGGPAECKSLACCTGVEVKLGKVVEKAEATCCASCQGCGDQIEIDDAICKGAATQAIAVIDEVPPVEKNQACGAECGIVMTPQGAEACYNCLASAGLLDDLCGENPSRPVAP